MPRARRSLAALLWLAGVAVFLLGVKREDARPRPTAPGVAPAATRRPIWRARASASSLAAAALCALLAAGLVGVHQVNQMREDADVAVALTGGDPTNAAGLAIRYGCAGCHTIPGLPGAHGLVAAPLAGLRRRVYIAGRRSQHGREPGAVDHRPALAVAAHCDAGHRDLARRGRRHRRLSLCPLITTARPAAWAARAMT